MNTLKRSMFAMSLATLVGAVPAAGPTADLSWLAGHWCQEKGAELVEEHWLPPRAGMMLSAGRTTVGGETRSFEFLRIELAAGKVTFIAQPDGAPPTAFALTASGPGWARFENPAHDFPKRVEYRRTPTGLRAEIAGPGKGGEKVIGFDYLVCRAGTY